jgi:hypothetical protein
MEKKNKSVDKPKGQPPIKQFRCKDVNSSIFESESINDDKSKSTYYNIVFQKSFTRDDGKTWEHTQISMSQKDLIKLHVVLTNTINYLYLDEDNSDTE